MAFSMRSRNGCRSSARVSFGWMRLTSTAAMGVFLQRFSATLAEDEHVVMVLDGAGWHTSHDLAVPSNLSLLRLPPYSPELNPVERIWLYLRERHFSHRVLDDDRAVLDAVCDAWCKLTPERIRSLCGYPSIRQINS